MNSNWNNFDNNLGPPWIKSFCQMIEETNPPAIYGKTLYITSDYSGNEKKSRYSVISILLADIDNSVIWENKRRLVRTNFLADGRRMSFKGLNDRQRRQALIPFLQAADNIHGLCVTIAIDKRIQNIVDGNTLLNYLNQTSILKNKWKPRKFENMFRVINFVSLLIAGVSKPKQNIYWISDEDEILANFSIASDVSHILSSLTSLYVKYPLGELGVGTTKIDEGDRLEEDFAAIPDIIAGSIAELMTELMPIIREKHIRNFLYPTPNNISLKTELVLSWFADQTQGLKRTVLVFDKIDNKGFRIWRLGQE